MAERRSRKTPRKRDIGTFHNMPPVFDPVRGELNESWLGFIRALARAQANSDYELDRKIRAERPDWDGVVMLGKVFDTIDDFAQHYELGPGDFTVMKYRNGKLEKA